MFGNGGKVITIIPNTRSFSPSSLIVQGDLKIVVGASGYVGTKVGRDIALLRYNTDGDLDNAFGNGGIVINDSQGDDHVNSLLLQPDGKLVVAAVITWYS